MIALELISDTVPAINKDDKASEALNWMDVFKVTHLPIINNNEYLGLISELDIFDLNNTDIPVIKHPLTLPKPYIKSSDHIFEVAELASKYKLTTIPVIDEADKYAGLITIHDLALEFTHLMNTESPGGIIVLEVKTNDYALSEIARIIEENNSKILSLYTQTNKFADRLKITIKINKIDISAIIKTFERFSYKILEIHSENSTLDSLTQDRINSFLKYLNI
jgi:CBS domain-containing protein